MIDGHRYPRLLFARTFFRHPKMLGSLLPSSRYLIRNLLGQVDWKRARVLVEYGPGVGTITAEILQRLDRNGVLVVIERSEEFAEFLKSYFADRRLHVVHGSAEDVAQVLVSLGLKHADYIISGIPYSVIPEATREAIIRESRKVLRPGGAFLVYQFTSAVKPHLTRIFGEVRQDFELRNILPARIFLCSR